MTATTLSHDDHALQQLDLQTRAEVHKLAQLLKLSADQLADLGPAGAGDLARLRRHIAQRVNDDRRDGMRRLASLTRLLPARYAAGLAQRALGPRITARLVGEMEPLQARNIARHITAAFVADAAPHVDPERVQALVPTLPVEQVRDAALLLAEQGDYITMGRFADALSPQQLRAVVSAIESDAVLLRTAFFVERREQLSGIVYNIDNDRIARIMRTGTSEGLLPEALSVIDHVDDELKARLANIMGAQERDALNALVDVAHRQRLWAPILRGMAHMHPKFQRRIVNLPALRDEALLADLVRAAYEEDLFEQALPLVKPMRPELRRVVAHAALSQGNDVAEAALRAAQSGGHWDVILDLAQDTDAAERDMLAGLPVLQRREVLEDVIAAIDTPPRAEAALDILGRMPADGLHLAATAATDDYAMGLERILDLLPADSQQMHVLARALATLDDRLLRTAAEPVATRDARLRDAFTRAAQAAGVHDRLQPYLTDAA